MKGDAGGPAGSVAAAEHAPSAEPEGGTIAAGAPGTRGDAAPTGVNRRHLVLIAIWIALVGVLTIPQLVGGVDTHDLLDSSFIMALTMAHLQGLHWGSQIVFTYGPLGFLVSPLPFDTGSWLTGVAVRLLLHLGFLMTLASVLRNQKAPVWVWTFVTCVLVLDGNATGTLGETPVFAVVMLWYGVAAARRRVSLPTSVLGAVLLALLALIKGSFLLLLPATLLLFVIAGALRRRWLETIAAPVAAIVALIGGWLLTGQSLSDVGPFVRGSLSIASGYSQAMSLGGFDQWVVAGMLVPIGLVALTVLAWQRQALRSLALAALLLPLSVVAYKEGFVRDEGPGGHPQEAFGAFVAMLTMLVPVVVAEADRLRWVVRRVRVDAGFWAAGALVSFAVLGFAYATAPVAALGTTLGQLKATAHLVVSAPYRELLRTQMASDIRAAVPLAPDLLDAVAGQTVDVMPANIALVQAYGLHWDPRPVLQSYGAYAPDLDELDAAFLRGPHAPDRIIFSVESVDDRYPLWDEPAAFRALLENYQPVTAVSDGMVVLARRSSPVDDTASQLGQVCAPLGAPVTVPSSGSRWTFARVDLPLSLLGRLQTVALRAPAVTIEVVRQDGSVEDFRFVTAVGPDGLIMNDTSHDARDLAALFEGGSPGPEAARSVRVFLKSSRAYANQVCVSFFGVG